MADREKLIILLNDHVCLNQDTCKEECNACMADHLIANGVTVGKPLTEYLHPIDAYEGLKAKYLVFKANTGERISDCFVLRPAKDPAAVEALRAYASTTGDNALASDIINWVGKGATVQRWISVTESLPAEHDSIFARFYNSVNWMPGMFLTTSDDVIATVTYEDGRKTTKVMRTCDGKWNLGYAPGAKEVTHWMPLPEPPKVVQ